MRALARPDSCAAAALGVLAFWGGLAMAAHRYPAEYDWRYMTLSNLVFADRNPEGYPWAWGGLILCALGGLCWTRALIREGRQASERPLSIGIWALMLGYLCMVCCALWSKELLGIPRSHEALAIAAFLGLCVGIVQLTLQIAGKFQPRLITGLLAGIALAPVLLAGVALAYVAYALPELPWVGLAWRTRGVPVYLSFAFWEWISCAVFSLYTVSLCLAMKILSRHAMCQRLKVRGQPAPSARRTTDHR